MRLLCLVCLLIATLSCDPAVNRTFHVTRLHPFRSDTASSRSHLTPLGPLASDSAILALEQLVFQFGFQRAISGPKHCAKAWDFQHPRIQRALHVCIIRESNDSINVAVAEILTSTWSLKADSLLNALSDTLRRFGRVRITEEKQDD